MSMLPHEAILCRPESAPATGRHLCRGHDTTVIFPDIHWDLDIVNAGATCGGMAQAYTGIAACRIHHAESLLSSLHAGVRGPL